MLNYSLQPLISIEYIEKIFVPLFSYIIDFQQ